MKYYDFLKDNLHYTFIKHKSMSDVWALKELSRNGVDIYSPSRRIRSLALAKIDTAFMMSSTYEEFNTAISYELNWIEKDHKAIVEFIEKYVSTY